MLDLPRYLVGVADIALLASFATLGAHTLRTRLLPTLDGAPALLATTVLALAILQLTAQLLGSAGLFEPLPYAIAVAAVGTAAWLLSKGGSGGPPDPPPFTAPVIPTLIALAIAAAALAKFGIDTRTKLGTGMTGFDTTWYHGPLAAELFQTGSTWDLHLIAPQFLAWFYPANAEVFHAAGMLAFDRDVLSPLLNLGWFAGCLLACWCIGRPYGAAPWSLALGAVALSAPAFFDQAGEARNDIVGTFFLLAAVAIPLNGGRTSVRIADRSTTARGAAGEGSTSAPGMPIGAVAVAALAAGLAAGTKLNFLLPAGVLVLGLALVAPAGWRWRSLGVATLAAAVGGGYWYLRNLVHSGNPLPWIDGVGPLSLPSPDQPLGGREGHSVLGYLTDGVAWSDWFLPGLAAGLWPIWPLLLAAALTGLALSALAPVHRFRRSSPSHGGGDEQHEPSGAAEGLPPGSVLAIAGLVGLATVLAWLVAPTSASGPEGMPRGFESGLRYLVPALILGLALIPTVLRRRPPHESCIEPRMRVGCSSRRRVWPAGWGTARGRLAIVGALGVVAAIAIGYPVQRHYLENRYADPTFAAPGLNAAFEWARGISGARIATTGTRIYPLYGTDLSNHVRFIGEPRPQGGFVAPTTCRQWRRLLNAGAYDYAIATRDRVEPGKPDFPAAARWTEGPGATAILQEPPTIVYQLSAPLDPSACP